MTQRVLVVDDDEAGCRLLRALFASEGWVVSYVHDGQSGLERVAAEPPDVLLLDLHLPELDGLEVLSRLRESHPALPVVMMTAHGEVKSAVRATQLGAVDYLIKPIDHDEIVLVVRRVLETRALKAEVEELRRRVGHGALPQLMGPSPQVARVVEQVQTVAGSDFSVLVLGETGTGKELVAQAIHQQSARRDKPFIAIDCGAIPEALLESELFGHEKGAFTGADRRKPGHFHLAERGTLFLDEVGNLPAALQAKLLRVLESRQVQPVGAARATALDVRFVAATNEDLEQRVQDGRFRADLYFRLAQYTISLPPLRERISDIEHLARRFMEETSIELRRPVQRIDDAALALLQKHRWPGNVRELRNVIRQAVLESKELVLQRSTLQRGLAQPASQRPTQGKAPKTLRQAAEHAAREAERQLICETLRTTRGNKSKAARALETDYKTLHVKMKSLGIRAKDFDD